MLVRALQALALLCSPVVSGKLVWLFGLDCCISWKKLASGEEAVCICGRDFSFAQGKGILLN